MKASTVEAIRQAAVPPTASVCRVIGMNKTVDLKNILFFQLCLHDHTPMAYPTDVDRAFFSAAGEVNSRVKKTSPCISPGSVLGRANRDPATKYATATKRHVLCAGTETIRN